MERIEGYVKDMYGDFIWGVTIQIEVDNIKYYNFISKNIPKGEKDFYKQMDANTVFLVGQDSMIPTTNSVTSFGAGGNVKSVDTKKF